MVSAASAVSGVSAAGAASVPLPLSMATIAAGFKSGSRVSIRSKESGAETSVRSEVSSGTEIRTRLTEPDCIFSVPATSGETEATKPGTPDFPTTTARADRPVSRFRISTIVFLGNISLRTYIPLPGKLPADPTPALPSQTAHRELWANTKIAAVSKKAALFFILPLLFHAGFLTLPR